VSAGKGPPRDGRQFEEQGGKVDGSRTLKRAILRGTFLLFAAVPATAVVLAVKAARAGHRSGRIALVVSGSLLAATLFLTLPLGWIGLVVTAVVAVLVFAWARPRGGCRGFTL
jgi:hypothetical protein